MIRFPTARARFRAFPQESAEALRLELLELGAGRRPTFARIYLNHSAPTRRNPRLSAAFWKSGDFHEQIQQASGTPASHLTSQQAAFGPALVGRLFRNACTCW